MHVRSLAHFTRFLALLACALFAAASWAASGTLLGTTLTPFPGGENGGHRIVVQPDGKMILVGYAQFGTQQYSMTRYNTDGTVDTTYGQNRNGTQLEPLGPGNGQAWGAALTSAGKLVVGGYVTSDKTRFGIAQFNTDGTLDISFGGGGAAVAVGPGDSGGYALAIDADGKVVQAGYATGPTGKKVFAVVRYLAGTTTLDSSFGTNGEVIFAEGAGDQVARSVLVNGDGTISVAGYTTNGIVHARLTASGALDTTYAGGAGIATIPNVIGGYDMSRQADGKLVITGNTLGAQSQVAVVRVNANGTLDTTFGTGGIASANIGATSTGWGVLALGNGQIAVSGTGNPTANNNAFLARFNANGTLDTTFGTSSGFTATNITGNDQGFGLALRPNGSFVIAGQAPGQGTDSLIVGLTSNGAGDPSFNGTGYSLLDAGGALAAAYASAKQGDGKVVVAGTVFSTDATGGKSAVVRYNTDGTLDTTFGTSGYRIFDVYRTNAVAIAPDGRIVTGGYSIGGSSGAARSMTFARFNTDGSLDTSFGSAGIATVPVSNNDDEINAVAVQADGKVVGAGFQKGDTWRDATVVRLNTNGTLDTTFNGSGRSVSSMSTGDDLFTGVKVQGDGKIVAAGWLEVSGLQDSMGAVRFNTDGTVDSGFGTSGQATVTFGSQIAHANGMTLQSDGKILLAGQVFGSSTWDFALARLNTNGTLDTGFGTSGLVQSDFGNHNEAFAVAQLASGKIVAAGLNGDFFGAAQYLANGTLDTTFGTGGFIAQQVNAASPDIAYGLTIGADGTLYLAGNASQLFGLARFSGDSGGTTLADATVSLASSSNPSTPGQAVTFTAVLTGSAGTPTGTVTFNDGGSAIPGCSSVTVTNGSAACGTSALTAGSHAITAVYSGSATYNGATSNTVNQAVQAGSTETNFALASNGGVASASSQLNSDFPVNAVNNGDRKGTNWSAGGGWADGTFDTYPDWVQVDFNGAKLIDKVVVYTLQDNWQSPAEPTDSMTFTQYGVTGFTVQGWTGSAWQTLATITGNNLVKRTVTFTAFNTTKIRVNVTSSLASLSRLTEIEAFGVPGTDTGPTPTNVALASSGATAIASSTAGAGFAASGAINGDASGANWSNGGGWADGTVDAYPDWLEVDFNGTKVLDHVVVYTLQDNWQSPSQPTDGMTFTQYGIQDFTVQGWDGSQWVVLGTVTNNNLVKRTVTLDSPFTTSKIRVVVTRAMSSLSRITEVEAWGTPSDTQQAVNVALSSAGGVASSSSQLSTDFPASAINNGDRAGTGWSAGGGWADATPDTFPDWVQVDFNGAKALTSVVVYTLQDNWQNPVEPTDSMTFTQYGVTGFTVQGWDGTQWVTLATVTGNNLVKRTVTFSSFTTTKIRVNVTGALNSYSRITEVEAWGTAAGPTSTNVALASNGAVALASSTLNSDFPVNAVNNGDRKGMNWSAGGGWADGTPGAFPDWVEIDFNGSKALTQINVYTLQDNWQSPVEPTDGMTFTQYGITDYTVQAWDGSTWQTIGTASGNNLVKRSFNVNVTTTRIRVNVTGALNSYSRITEIEAMGN